MSSTIHKASDASRACADEDRQPPGLSACRGRILVMHTLHATIEQRLPRMRQACKVTHGADAKLERRSSDVHAWLHTTMVPHGMVFVNPLGLRHEAGVVHGKSKGCHTVETKNGSKAFKFSKCQHTLFWLSRDGHVFLLSDIGA